MDKNSIKEPVVSVCIANYNGETYISECIDSILNQAFDLPVEIIVHDDASTDNSIQILESSYPQVKLLKSDKNTGFCISNNRMVAQATGKFLLLLNNDAQLHTDALQALYDYAKNNESAIIGLPQYDYDTKALLDVGNMVDIFLNPVPGQQMSQRQVAMVIGACLWISRSTWQKTGGFPEWFGSIAEDMFICLAARIMGSDVVALNQSGYNHHVGKSLGGGKVKSNQLNTTFFRRNLSERNKTFVMFICYPGILLYLIAPLHIITLYAEGVLLTVLKRDTAIWNQIYKNILPALWSQRENILDLRSMVQKSRKISVLQFMSIFVWFPYKLKMLLKYGLPKIT